MSKEKVNSFEHAGASWRGAKDLDEGVIDELNIAVIIEDRQYDLAIKWHDLGTGPAAELCIFHDAFDLFEKAPEIFAILANHSDRKHSAAPETVCDALIDMGYADLTKRVKPEAAPKSRWWQVTLQDGDIQEPIRVEACTAHDASKLARQIIDARWVVLSAEPE